MTTTLDEILQCEDRLHAEIAERECLLAAVNVLKGYAEKGRSLRGLELGALGKALLTTDGTKTLLLAAPAEKPADVAPPPPALPRPKPYRHPELEKLCPPNLHGRDTMAVRWAIERMTGDFTLIDIAKLLKTEGQPMGNPKISVVLTRMQRHGHIQVIEYGRGPVPTVFRNPNVTDETPVAEAA
ncbi:MAG: hypothetical protein M3Y69_02135 [Verrucomicrobiota bacterium]|nr:hypothetical protein [Verrucomicrobiota bacterium]